MSRGRFIVADPGSEALGERMKKKAHANPTHGDPAGKRPHSWKPEASGTLGAWKMLSYRPIALRNPLNMDRLT